MIYNLLPTFLRSGVITSSIFTGVQAKEINVSTTFISLKDPDIESLPPIAGLPISLWAMIEPSIA